MELLKKIKIDGITDEFYNWVSRDKFHELKDSDTWMGGLIKTCWSFGNDQKTYIFSPKIEETKRLLHEVVVNKCNNSINQLKNIIGIDIDSQYLNYKTINERRLKVMGLVKSTVGRIDLQHLENIQQLTRLQNLERINLLIQINNKIDFNITNLSYDEVNITTPIDETIIYLDSPYRGKYQLDIDHDQLLNYINNSPYKIYVSSYEFDLPRVFDSTRRCNFSSTSNNNKLIESLFCNK